MALTEELDGMFRIITLTPMALPPLALASLVLADPASAAPSAVAAAATATAAPPSVAEDEDLTDPKRIVPNPADDEQPDDQLDRAWFGGENALPWREWERATGNWGGFRTDLENAGLSFGAEYIAEYSSVLSGGVDEDGSFRNLFTADLTLDFEQAFDLDGGTLFVQYLSVNPEEGGSMDAGDIQVYSNIENDFSMDVIYELWYEQSLFDDRLRIKVGKVDANTEFAFVDVAGEFANSSAGFSPTIFVFPSYPNPAMSVNVHGRVVDTDRMGATLSYGLYDGAAQSGFRTGTRGPSTFGSEDFFHIFEATLDWRPAADGGRWLREGRLSLGGWVHTAGDFERFDGGTEDGTEGLYLTYEQMLFNPDGPDGDRGVFVFGQYGWADEDVSEIAQHIAGGVATQGTFSGREMDSAGIYLTFADLSDEPAAGFEEDKFVIDAHYRLHATPAVHVQPEAQDIVDPSGDPDIDDAFVAGVRVGIVF